MSQFAITVLLPLLGIALLVLTLVATHALRAHVKSQRVANAIDRVDDFLVTAIQALGIPKLQELNTTIQQGTIPQATIDAIVRDTETMLGPTALGHLVAEYGSNSLVTRLLETKARAYLVDLVSRAIHQLSDTPNQFSVTMSPAPTTP
jgi:hypothetical protein